MKTVKTLLPLLLVLLLVTQNGNAQFMKKLGDKLERKVNQRLERKVDRSMDKALDKTEESIDNSTKRKNKNTEAKSDSPSSEMNESDFQLESVDATGIYDFEWKYTLQMTSKSGDMKIIYYLKPNAKYFGFKPESAQTKSMGGMFTVMDEGMSKMLMFMDMNGSKIVNAMKMPKNMVEKAAENQKEYTMTELGTKTIMGYHCQGIKVENDEHTIISYYTTDAPVSFTQIYGSDPKNMPKGFNPKFLKNADKALMMEMTMTDKKKSKRNMTMKCIELKKENLSINASEYKSFGGGFGSKN